MNLAAKLLLLITVVTIAGCNIHAQDEGDDDPKGNVNLGMPISGPLNPTAQFVNLGLGTTVGAGYNFTRRHAVVGEFMWNNLFPTNGALAPIKAASQNPNLSAGGNLYAFTENYRFELRGKAVGTYV